MKLGRFGRVIVPMGLWLSLSSPASAALVTVVLPYGITVSGHVTDAAGVAVADVYVHFYPPGSSERFFTVRDKTDASGNYSVVVPTIACGLYDVKYGPPLGTRYLALTRP